MKEFCEIQYCESPGAKEVPVSVHKPSDQKRTFCIPCHEAYIIGCQHGRMASQATEIWIVAIADRGIVVFVKAYGSEPLAMKGVASYLRTNHGYRGKLTREEVNAWLEENDERLSMEVTCQNGFNRGQPALPKKGPVDRFLAKQTFVILTKNAHDPSPNGPYEAWAYEAWEHQKPLDFSSEQAITFGVGSNARDAIHALELQLESRPGGKP